MSNLDKIMKPKSVAVIGASTKEHTIGSDIMKRLQESTNSTVTSIQLTQKVALSKDYKHILQF